MKKVLFLFAFLGAFLVNAQTVNLTFPSKTTYMKVPTDYTVTNTTVRTFIYLAPAEFTATQDYLIELDSVSGNHTNVAVALYGSKFSSSAYSAIGSTINWKGTTADTTIVISNATANRYRYYKVTVTGTGTGVTKVDNQEFKLYKE